MSPIKRNRKGRKKGPVRAKPISCNGYNFKSGLERYCYLALKEAKLFEGYENEKFTLLEGFDFTSESYERQANSKGEFRQRGKSKVRGITYTPDFCGKTFIIECKGRPNESFPLRYKLFKKHLNDIGDTRVLYKPQNQKEIDEMISIIKNKKLC